MRTQSPRRLKALKVNIETFNDIPQVQDHLRKRIKELHQIKIEIRQHIKELEGYAKIERHNLNRAIQDESFYKKEIIRSVQRFKSKYYTHRKWAEEHPIEALSKTLN